MYVLGQLSLNLANIAERHHGGRRRHFAEGIQEQVMGRRDDGVREFKIYIHQSRLWKD